MPYGFYVTSAGWELLGRITAQALQKNTKPVVQFQRVRFGDGKIPEGENPALLQDLVHYVADGSSSPVHVEVMKGEDGTDSGCVLSFVVEYASNFRLEGEDAYPGATYPADITTSKLLTEWTVDILDVENDVVVSVVRGYFAENPRPVVPFNGASIDIARFPVSLAFDEELEVTLAFPSKVFVSYDDLHSYVDDSLNAHNHAPFSPETHPEYWARIKSNADRLTTMYETLGGQGSTEFFFDFVAEDSGIPVPMRLIQGVWNQAAARLEW